MDESIMKRLLVHRQTSEITFHVVDVPMSDLSIASGSSPAIAPSSISIDKKNQTCTLSLPSPLKEWTKVVFKTQFGPIKLGTEFKGVRFT